MGKAKKAHRAKVQKRNQKIQNERKQFDKVLEQIRQAQEFSKANGDEQGPGYRIQEDVPVVRQSGLPNFVPLTGSEEYNPNKEVWIAGPSTVRGGRVKLGE